MGMRLSNKKIGNFDTQPLKFNAAAIFEASLLSESNIDISMERKRAHHSRLCELS